MTGVLTCALPIYQREIDSGQRRIVGVNAYQDGVTPQLQILAMDPQGYEKQLQRLQDVRQTRDAGRAGQALDALRLACRGEVNTMPYLLDAVHAYCTLGEIISVMKAEFGTYHEPTWI